MTQRYPSLDGWRGLAILFVLAGHLLPLGPKSWQLNSAVAATGMVIFFNLSGFLITSLLLHNRNITQFLIRRLLRIVPLAWMIIFLTLVWWQAPFSAYFPHLFFYANWGTPMALTAPTSHFWSLCVEMQFYIGIAGLVFLLRGKSFYCIPLLALSFTALRWHDGVGIAINTYYRADEILAGGFLALLYFKRDILCNKWLQYAPPLVFLPLVILSAHPNGGFVQYLRPYLSMLLIGSTLFHPERHPKTTSLLNNKFLLYTATISYALYVIHGGLRYTWLGEGDKIIRYLKRPLLFFTTFVLAHFSTFYYEHYWIQLGKKINRRLHHKY